MSGFLVAGRSNAMARLSGLVSAFIRALALSFVFVALSAAATRAETEPQPRRVALVIGNGAYKHAPQLPNPTKDASDIAAKLTELGFDVVAGLDLDMTKFGETLREFSRRIEGADVGLLFMPVMDFKWTGSIF